MTDSFQERRLVLMSADLAGFTRCAATLDALAVAKLLDEYYTLVAGHVAGAGGRVVKFMGDGCFAVFPEEACVAAVDAALAAAAAADRLCAARGLPMMRAGANLHLATVADGTFAADGRYDVVGAAVNHLFRMGGGGGVRLSEPVYRKLPNDQRGRWTKNKPPATYARL